MAYTCTHIPINESKLVYVETYLKTGILNTSSVNAIPLHSIELLLIAWYHFIVQKKLFPMMFNSSTFSTAGLSEIAVTQLGPILYNGSPPGVSFASSSFIPLQCVPQACVRAMNRVDMAILTV